MKSSGDAEGTINRAQPVGMLFNVRYQTVLRKCALQIAGHLDAIGNFWCLEVFCDGQVNPYWSRTSGHVASV